MKIKLILLFLALNFMCFAQNQQFIFVSDAGNYNNPPWQILKYDFNGQTSEVFTKDSLAWPQDILFLENEEVLISNLNSGKLNIHNSKTGKFKRTFANNIAGPTRTKIGKDGLLYVLQWSGNGKVLRFNTDGEKKDEFIETGVPQSIGLDWDEDGNLYISSFQEAQIMKFDKNGKDLGVFAKDSLQGPTNIWFGKNKNLYALDWKAGALIIFDSEGNFKEKLITGLNRPEGITVQPNGDLIIGNGATGEVKLYSSDGTFIMNLVEANKGGLKTPNAVIVHPKF